MIQKKKFSDAIAANISVVGELLGTLNQKQNASTSSQMRYVKIATLGLTDVSEQEGISNTVTLLVVGGNAYSTVRQVSFVSITSHRGVIYAKKNSILSSVEIGYSVNDQILDVWVHATNYNHYINSVLLGTTYASLKSDIQVEMPNNYQVIE